MTANPLRLATAAALMLAAGSASAQQAPLPDMPGMAMPAGADQRPSTKMFQNSMARMHQEVGATYTGDTDVDFVHGMIPHHQGAIDMARTELKYGRDPKLKAMARGIITAQRQEIATLKAWLARHGH